ncbi:fibrinogen-binding adhesin SdrG C-terminal domain-containing protein [Staphylococcus hyicus]|uniref:fibrinogen-binding adhesin SdrG C-terminal domain-containing protein n=1 Tax=Staphylococcus hyicus TaxID=1284 RepID=UPI00273A36B9|nr:fibrinogen-binding adhesin SdrG C-terminal domain-containing protein [Staphylococcus hyicus]MDP4468660.1 fibrinogen-binding adhesin SdrG C-terminal domain-containing protein [Staphylococcus hyicus]
MTKRQKYGIRKYKIGAASIALGSVIVVGMSEGNEAQASEIGTTEVTNNTTDETSNKTNNLKEQPVESTENNMNFEAVNDSQKISTNEEPNESVISNKVGNSENEIVQPSNLVSNENTPKEVVAPSTLAKPKQVESNEYSLNHNMEPIKGNNVSEKVKVNNATIISKDSSRVVNPHNAEKVTLKYNWKFEDGIKSNDYFDFYLSDNVDTKGISTKRKTPEIRTKDNQNVIAYGEVLNDNKLRYTFTDYVNEKTDLAAELTLNLFFKPSTVLNDGYQEVSSTLGNYKVKNDFYVKHLNGVTDYYGMNINGRIDTLDKETSTFSHYIYINPTQHHMSNVEITGLLEKGKPTNGSSPQVTIYKYLDNKPLPQSVYSNFNSKDFKDVTKSFNINIKENGEYSTKFENLNGDTYIIKYDGVYNESDSNLTFRTILKGAYTGYPHYYRTLTWDNGVQFYSNSASGSGTDKPIPIFETSRPIYLDYNTMETISGQNNYEVLEESEDTIDAFTYQNQVVEIDEISNTGGGEVNHTSNVIEYDEDTAKGIVTGAASDHTTIEDTMEYTTESILIEIEDKNTLPPSISGQVEGSVEEIEEISYVDINDYTMTEGANGQADGTIEEVEENQHVDIVEITTPMGEQGQSNGSIEEIEENHLIEFDDYSGTGEVNGENKDPVEEIVENHVIDFMSESGVESGSNEHIDFEEDTEKDQPSYKTGGHNPIEFVEDTTPHIDGSNQGLVEEEDTLPNSFVPPLTPKEDKPEIPPTPEVPKANEPKENIEMSPTPEKENEEPKVEKHIVPKSPKVEKEEHPKVKFDQSHTPHVVSEKPKFKEISTIQTSTSNKVTETNKEAKSDLKELPQTGDSSDKNPLLFGGLISLIGLAFIRRNMKEKINF